MSDNNNIYKFTEMLKTQIKVPKNILPSKRAEYIKEVKKKREEENYTAGNEPNDRDPTGNKKYYY